MADSLTAETAARTSGRGVLWVAMGEGGAQLLSLLIFLVLARHVSPASFGLVAVSLATIELLRRVLIDPVTYVVTAKPGVRVHDFDICFTLSMLITAAAALLLFAGAPQIAALIGVPQAAQTLRVLSLVLVALGLAGTPGSWLVRRMEFRALALRSLLSVGCGGAVGVTMALMGFGLWSLVGQQLANHCVSVVSLWAWTTWRPRLAFDRGDLRENLRKAWPISTGAIWTSIANDADLFFVAAFLGVAAAGFYNAAKRIMLAAAMMLVHTIGSVVLPTFANLDCREDRGGALLAGLRFTAVLTAPAFAGLAVVAPEFITLVLGAKWAAAASILSALAISGFAASLDQFATYLLLVEQRAHLDARTSAISALIRVVAFVLAARAGPLVLALTVTVTAFLVLPIRFRYAIRDQDIGWSDLFVAVAPSIGATLAMVGCLMAARELLAPGLPAWLALPVLIGLGVAAYGLLLRLLAPTLFRSVTRLLALSLLPHGWPARPTRKIA